jgi:hypothetical protein
MITSLDESNELVAFIEAITAPQKPSTPPPQPPPVEEPFPPAEDMSSEVKKSSVKNRKRTSNADEHQSGQESEAEHEV